MDYFGIIGSLVGVGGFVFGIFSYHRNELDRRKQTIFPLIEEFDTDKNLFIAKSLLDNYSFRKDVLNRFSFTNKFDLPNNVSNESYFEERSILAEGNESIAEYENPTDLQEVLRDHIVREVRESSEIVI